jgi:site-specific DNA-methyltransferase (adenine-specific)
MTTFTLHTGDCLNIMPAIPAGSVDMILCDLPYGVTARNKWDEIIPFDELWPQYARMLKENGAIVLTATQPFASHVVTNSPSGWFKYEWIWRKPLGTGFLNAKKQPLRNHEQVLVFYRSQPTYNPQMRVGFKPYNCKQGRSSTNYGEISDHHVTVSDGSRYPVTVLEFAYDSEKFHPTQKPIALMEYLIRTYTNENETVLDNCMGSGTTGVACMNTGRSFVGIERDPKYFEIARSRIEAAQMIAIRNETDWLACLDLPVIGQESASGLTIQ